MPDIELRDLTKRYGAVKALDQLSARASAGRITVFLGANGSGKTTTMRILLGLSAPESGRATLGGKQYRDLSHPLRFVGALLDQGFHPNRSARNHLRIVAAQAGVPAIRAEEVLEDVGLTDAADRRVGGYSLGMRQRLGLAAAMVGRPETLVLDEPFNGLDPAGILTVRAFLRHFVDSGGTVLLSSHLLSELAHSADDAIIIDRGRLVAAGPVAELMSRTSGTLVATSDADVLSAALTADGATVERTAPGTLTVRGASLEEIGRAALDVHAVITELRPQQDGLETAFTSLIHGEEQVS